MREVMFVTALRRIQILITPTQVRSPPDSQHHSTTLMKLSISLNKPKAAKAEPPPIQRPSAFLLGEDDEPDEVVSIPATGNKTGPSVPSKSMKKKMEAEKQVDATVYEYDEVWDRMQAAKQQQKAAKEAESSVRKVITTICIIAIPRTHTILTA